MRLKDGGRGRIPRNTNVIWVCLLGYIRRVNLQEIRVDVSSKTVHAIIRVSEVPALEPVGTSCSKPGDVYPRL